MVLFLKDLNYMYLTENINLKVSDILSNGVWSYNNELHQIFHNFKMPEVLGGEDILLWTRNLIGEFSTSEAVNKLRNREQSVNWSKYLWTHFLHHFVARNVWKLIQGIYTDDKSMVKNRYEIVSRCRICETEQDSMNHLLWECNFSIDIWRWICFIFQFKLPKSFEDIWKCASNCSPLVKQVWITTVCIILKELWFQKNKIFFEDIKPNMQGFKCRIMKFVNEGGLRITGTKWNQNYDHEMIEKFQLGFRHSGFRYIKKYHWLLPEQDIVMFCCDVSSFGNTGSQDVVLLSLVRDSACQVLGTLSGSIGVASNYLAESYGIMCALELEIQWSMHKIIIMSDSKYVLAEFSQERVPWFLKGRWHMATRKLNQIEYQRCYREVNFPADCMAKKGALLAAGERKIHIGRPQCLPRVEMENVEYFRFG
ncbi:uncharacterized protein LOC113361555 [Papaver somniferum]|uniref:uncharacterized protein LOC113361555 n=1 Tax=Papaver somniferum TaxID=3469 RepID=UPI000E6F56A3|nr:uncharacterized protein LOC113361555 [Papaver somniferum]